MGIVLQVGVKALLKNTEGKYLLLKRSLKKYPDITGRWDIPGGRIEPGTPLIENLKREIKEETSLELTDTPLLIAAQDILKGTERHIVRLTYTANITGIPVVDNEENEDFLWVTPEELEKVEDLDYYLTQLIPSIQG